MHKVIFLIICIIVIYNLGKISHWIYYGYGLRRRRKKLNKYEKHLRNLRNGSASHIYKSDFAYEKMNGFDFELSMVNLRKPVPELYKERKSDFEKWRKRESKYGHSKLIKMKKDSLSWGIKYNRNRKNLKTS